ncbi:MAG: hypothetical protein ACE5KM_00370 [Planctomycetaceae bacterium]
MAESPQVPDAFRLRIERDYERFARDGWPDGIEDYLLHEYELDVATRYAGLPIPNPWGKASGQLSMTARQVAEDVRAGLGFVVLKTVIAQDATGSQSMRDWAIPESRMLAERITGRSGERGWTVSWKGRGWWQSFEEYLQLVRDARQIAAGSRTLVVPSCKFHLPMPDESAWRTGEYDYTVGNLLDAWAAGCDDSPMPLEKDFSPTLAGSDRAAVQAKILEWLRRVPEFVHAAAGAGEVRLGLKVFNALFDDEFQLRMLRTIHEPPAGLPQRADYFVYGNRLFDPEREFEGHKGIAYGGPDLSDRNLRVLSRFCEAGAAPRLPLSATGNITTGKTAIEYALRGASSFQLHTFFQLPADVYTMKTGSKVQKALHELCFHPQTGFVVWMRCLADVLGLTMKPLRFRDVVGRMSDVDDRMSTE